MTDWKEIDSELRADNWNLQVNRHYDEWKAIYVNQCYIPRSAKGATLEEAICNAGKLVKEGG